MADNKKKRGGADRGLIALSEPYEVAYWSKKFKITPAKLKAAVKKAGHSAKKVEAYIKLQKHKAADRARIAMSQPYEVSYWSKKFKVTPARLKAAVAAVGHSSKNVGAYLTGSKKKSAKKTSKKSFEENCQEKRQEARKEKGRIARIRSPGEAQRNPGSLCESDPGFRGACHRRAFARPCAPPGLRQSILARQFAAKQYNSPSPPVLFRSACEQPPSGPREECEEFQDFEASSSRRPDAVGMTDHRRALRRARPVLAGAILAGRKRRPVRLRSRQHVVTVGCIAAAVDDLALLAERASAW